MAALWRMQRETTTSDELIRNNSSESIMYVSNDASSWKRKAGALLHALLPLPPGTNAAPGDQITFREATSDAFGIPTYVHNGDAVTVTLVKVRDDGDFKGQRLHYLAWEPLASEGVPK